MSGLSDMLQYGFMQRALLAGGFIAVLCAVLGVFLVFRRLSMIGDGLAHAAFGSVALSFLLGAHPLYLSIPLVMANALGILKLTERARVYGDAAIGIVSAFGIATGVILASVAGGFNIDLFSYLFGSILSISTPEVVLAVSLSLVVIGAVALFYQDLLSSTFDREFAMVSGINTRFLETLFALLTAVTVVISMRAVGIMLVSALLIMPPVTALQISRGFLATIVVASAVSLLSVFMGITASFVLNIPTGATIVAFNFVMFGLAFVSRALRRRFR